MIYNEVTVNMHEVQLLLESFTLFEFPFFFDYLNPS